MHICVFFLTFNCLDLALFERERIHIQTFRVSLFSTASDGEKRSMPFNPKILHIYKKTRKRVAVRTIHNAFSQILDPVIGETR